MHGYERFESTAAGANAVVTLVTGGGGGALGDVNANTSRTYCNERVSSGAFFHAAIFEITPGQLAATIIDEQGNVRDQFQHAVP